MPEKHYYPGAKWYKDVLFDTLRLKSYGLEATMYKGGTDRYKNPFGDGADGTESAGFAESVGHGLTIGFGLIKRKR